MRRLVATVVLTAIAVPVAAQVVGPSTGGAAALAQAERMVAHTKRVLMIAAHPDDEDTELLTYLVRKEGAVAAYLSLTRGEGGQNLIGPELGEALGLIRSEELLAARGLDGARQYFTRAFDFGYSKTQAEAFTFWPRDSVLKDVVRVVRRFRPQILVSIFSGTPRDGHGQHQVAGWAAREAFQAAGDPTRFPELASEEGLAPWQPLKLYRSTRFDTAGTAIVLQGGSLDPEIGQSYRQIAMRGRSLHRSQDMGMLQEIGPSAIGMAIEIDRTGAGPGLFSGVDTTAPKPGTADLRDLEPFTAAATAIRAGVVFDAFADESRLVPGTTVRLRLSTWNSGTRPVSVRAALDDPPRWSHQSDCLDRPVSVPPGAVVNCPVVVTVAPNEAVTTPYFLRQPKAGAWYRWSGDSRFWGDPFEPPLLTARFELTVDGGAPVALAREVFHRFRDQASGEIRRPLAVVPRVDVQIAPTAKVWALGERRPQNVTVAVRHAGRDTTSGTVALDLPPGWAAVPPQPFRLTRPDEHRSFTFPVTAPAGQSAGDFSIRAVARDQGGRRYETGVVVVAYPHNRERVYAVPATMAVRAAAMSLPKARKVGYIRGAADRVPEALAGVGLEVELLDAAMLERGDLSRFDAIVVGSRAYETDPALVENNGRLLDYVRQGGHVLVQYQQHVYFTGNFAPYPITVAPLHDRVTDEKAPVRLLRPDDLAFRVPNRIEAADWNGWVQERGLYFAHTWDPHYTPLLEMHDEGGLPLEGGLLVTNYGRGTYLYSGLSFFRQLTAGVPGAVRLFMNLLAMESRASQP